LGEVLDVIYDLGPRARRVFDTLRARIVGGELAPETQLPSYVALAAQFGVAPLTVRQVLAHLEAEGLVSRQQGRGTFVRTPARPRVLVVDDDAGVRQLLAGFVEHGGYRAEAAPGPSEALAALEGTPGIALILSDVRMPGPADGIAFIRTVRQRWPAVPLAAVTAYPADLDALVGTPEWPILVLTKPVRLAQILEVLQLLSRSGGMGHPIGLPQAAVAGAAPPG
jgi:CheY-like chemotaxis protein